MKELRRKLEVEFLGDFDRPTANSIWEKLSFHIFEYIQNITTPSATYADIVEYTALNTLGESIARVSIRHTPKTVIIKILKT